MLKKSRGHVGFYKMPYQSTLVEVYRYTDGDGSINLAPVTNAIDTDTGYRHGRFECYKARLEGMLADWASLGIREITS